MPTRKRTHDEIEASQPPECPPLLKRLRNMWEFANLMQFIFIFGDALKIDKDFDIEDLEAECLNHESSLKLAEIGLCLLKNVSSHRGLTPENFDEYTRRQYQAKKPASNPFGNEELLKGFHDFDTVQKIRVLVDLSQWTLINANSIKEKMELSERDQATEWRIQPIGWDREDRTYFVLDDNRLYRMSEPPIHVPEAPKKKLLAKSGKSRSAKSKPQPPPPTRGTRASKRLKVEHIEESQEEQEEDSMVEGSDTNAMQEATNGHFSEEENTLGGMKWECVAVTLEEYQEFLSTIMKTKDPNERALSKFVTTNVLPIIEAMEEKRRQKILRRQRELDALQKLATAKRSSRIAGKRQHEAEEAEARAAEEKRQRDLKDAQAMLLREQRMEQDRESRRLTREQRIKERELRRVIEEEALENLTAAEAQSEQSDAEARKSRRQLKAKIERKRKVVEELQQEEDWIFDCSGCGVHGPNLDDGSHSVACDLCNVWQHSACLGISEGAAEEQDFHFVCKDCKEGPKPSTVQKPPPIKLKLNQSPSQPPKKRAKKQHDVDDGSPINGIPFAETNKSTSNGIRWHNTFIKSTPPAYGSPAGSFIAFDPSRYYINGDLADKVNGKVSPAGFSPAGKVSKRSGLPPIGKFINHASKPAAIVPKEVLPKNLTNGTSASVSSQKALSASTTPQIQPVNMSQIPKTELDATGSPIVNAAERALETQNLQAPIDIPGG